MPSQNGKPRAKTCRKISVQNYCDALPRLRFFEFVLGLLVVFVEGGVDRDRLGSASTAWIGKGGWGVGRGKGELYIGSAAGLPLFIG